MYTGLKIATAKRFALKYIQFRRSIGVSNNLLP